MANAINMLTQCFEHQWNALTWRQKEYVLALERPLGIQTAPSDVVCWTDTYPLWEITGDVPNIAQTKLMSIKLDRVASRYEEDSDG